ncbi:putative adenosine deaminase 2 [Diaporthe ampelina]|uniref:Putative adenosine deaminase 2 n=1 Tax=Diaporthe ampelina TaxID=1214573 RepID=A0A0G2FJG0_9PEZI|nr:putative adenosine deaminase 2 [Diaporthe ampelina]
MTLKHPRTGVAFSSLEELQGSHDSFKTLTGNRMNNSEETLSFFEAYYGGFEVLKTTQDYHDLAMHYFERAASMNVRYCELFFDPQGHTRTGVSWQTMMDGFRSAQAKADKDLRVRSAWIMCFLRDEPVNSAMDHYLAALDYRDMIVGVGLDSNEDQRPPMLFEDIFDRARKDGFRLTAHCDVGKSYPIEHVRQVVCSIGKIGADRIDHGLNVVESADLMESIRSREMGMTICPWSYIRHQPLEEVFGRIRKLFDAGIRLTIASDDPAFMEDTWILENLLVVRRFCKFTDQDMIRLADNAIRDCWAPDAVKEEITAELRAVNEKYLAPS